jgi:large subunit ribosomal protein L32
MAVPKRRKTRSRRDMRRSHDALTLPSITIDVQTGAVHRRHFMLPNGTYRGNVIKFIAQDKIVSN